MSSVLNDLIPGGATPLANETTNVATSLGSAGASFGELIKGVGNAVAETQLKLTENSAAVTTKLAETLVDVIAVQETEIDDAGTVVGSKSHVQKLPLLNFIDPAFYNYPQVKIEGHFVMSSFAADTSTSVDAKSSSSGFGFGLSRAPGLFSSTRVSAGFSAGSSESSVDVDTSAKQATAVGRMRMFAQLRPEEGLGVPKPTQVIIGPSLALLEGPITEDTDQDGNTTRTMSILIQFRNKDGQPIKNKALSIDTDGGLWNFTDPNKTTTGDTAPSEGDLAIQLIRVFPPDSADPEAPPVDKSPKPVTLNVRKGLVANGITVEM
jgi:hypothetical protein